jgi:hypothetical protein
MKGFPKILKVTTTSSPLWFPGVSAGASQLLASSLSGKMLV